ncbi:MAG: hypothetical protein R2756_04045 [Bacteroidales bacterium]
MKKSESESESEHSRSFSSRLTLTPFFGAGPDAVWLSHSGQDADL